MIRRSSFRPRSLQLLASLAGICGITALEAAPQSTSTSVAASLSKPSAPSLTEDSGTAAPKYPWKINIVGTIFWVGELPTEKNPTPNTASSWDPQWMKTFGGFDDPAISSRVSGYRPAGFVPKLNPFYVALPYNDVVNYKTTKEEAAKIIPWFKDSYTRAGRSVCNNRWIAIRFKGQTCYAQWSDCGPFVTTDANYVFGDARPVNTKNNGAGIDLAPAVRDYLGFRSGQTCDWRFVDESEVPAGPWKDYGKNNPFSLASASEKKDSLPSYAGTKAAGSSKSTVTVKTASSRVGGTASSESQRLEELRKQRDLWFSQNGVNNRAR